MVTDHEGEPVVLASETHPYRGFLEEQYLLAYIEERKWTTSAGDFDADLEAIGQNAVDLLSQLWTCLEMVVGGDQIRPCHPADAHKTDLIFSPDACHATRNGNFWGDNRRYLPFHSRSFYVMFTALDEAGTSDQQNVRCFGGQSRRYTQLNEIRKVSMTDRQWSCCPQGHS